MSLTVNRTETETSYSKRSLNPFPNYKLGSASSWLDLGFNSASSGLVSASSWLDLGLISLHCCEGVPPEADKCTPTPPLDPPFIEGERIITIPHCGITKASQTLL
jgi:hypothetical protein